MEKNDVNRWIEGFTEKLAKESLVLITSYVGTKNETIAKKLYNKFLQAIIKQIIYTALSKYADKNLSNKAKYDLTYPEYQSTKRDVQDSIAMAFESAFREFTNKNVEYYCTIDIVPEPTNKKYMC